MPAARARRLEIPMKPEIGLTDRQRSGVIEILTATLADEYLLYTKTRNYHWNVVGPQFNDLHKLFETQYEALDDIMDDVAERSRSLGGHAIGTLAELAQHARLKENPGQYPDSHTMVRHLLADHEALVASLRRDLAIAQDQHGDAGTADFLTGLMEKHEKNAWMLRAILS